MLRAELHHSEGPTRTAAGALSRFPRIFVDSTDGRFVARRRRAQGLSAPELRAGRRDADEEDATGIGNSAAGLTSPAADRRGDNFFSKLKGHDIPCLSAGGIEPRLGQSSAAHDKRYLYHLFQ